MSDSTTEPSTRPGARRRSALAGQHPAWRGDSGVQPVEPAESAAVDGLRLLSLPLDQVSYNPRNPRTEDLEADPKTAELARSLRLLKQRQAALVIPRELHLRFWPEDGKKITGPYVVHEGNRRKAAHTLNGTEKMLCMVQEDADGPEQLALTPFHVNLHRKDLDPITIALQLSDDIQKLGGQRAAAEQWGKTQPWVAQHMALLKLIPPLQAAVSAREITASNGRRLGKLPPAGQEAIAAVLETLGDEQRADFWASAPWNDRRFNQPERSEAEPEREPRPRPQLTFVLKATDRSPRMVATALGEQFEPDEIDELIDELQAVKRANAEASS